MKRLLSGLAFFAAAASAQDAAPDSGALFAATLSGLDDKPVALESFRGKPLVLNFWARWCGPCREEIPDLVRRAEQVKDHRPHVLGVAIEDKADAVADFAKAYGMTYPVVVAKDKGVPLLQALGNPKAGLPFTLALDRQGRVVYRKLGRMTGADMDAAFAAALKP